MVDDSHAIGVVREHGRGSPEYCGVEGHVHIATGTLGKALGGASGGYVAGRKEIVEWLRERSRPYLFSNTLAPVIATTSLRAFDLIENGAALRARLAANSALSPTAGWTASSAPSPVSASLPSRRSPTPSAGVSTSGGALARASVGGGFPSPPFRLRSGSTVPP